MHSVTQDMRCRQSLLDYAQKYGVSRASRKYDKSRSYIYLRKAPYDGPKGYFARILYFVPVPERRRSGSRLVDMR